MDLSKKGVRFRCVCTITSRILLNIFSKERVGVASVSPESSVRDGNPRNEIGKGSKNINFGQDMEPDNTIWMSAEFGDLYLEALKQDNYERMERACETDATDQEKIRDNDFDDDFVVIESESYEESSSEGAKASLLRIFEKNTSEKAVVPRHDLWNHADLPPGNYGMWEHPPVNIHSMVMLKSSSIPFWKLPLPKLRIVIMAVGTRYINLCSILYSFVNIIRGDVQPFALLGRRLQRDGHRVRLATHACYRSYVDSMGLEYYPLAGDPVKLSEFMVKSHGCIVPTSGDVLREVPSNISMLNDILISTWGACTEADPEDVAERYIKFNVSP